MVTDINKIREANTDDLSEVDIEILYMVFEPTVLTPPQRIEIDHLYKILDAMSEYIQTKDHNVNHVASLNCLMEEIIVSMSEDKSSIEVDCGDHLDFIKDNEKGYTYEEMREQLIFRINEITEADADWFKQKSE